jgi:hypothetical protein
MTPAEKLARCFSPAFLARPQFGEYALFRSEKGALSKRTTTHPKYNTGPFSLIDPDWRRVAFHISGSNFACVDLDKCFNSSLAKPWASKFLLRWTLRTAHEISASKTGAHLFFHVCEPIPEDMQGLHFWDEAEGAIGDAAGKAELYVNRKWLALTGTPVFNDPHPAVTEITVAELRELMEELAAMRPHGKSTHKRVQRPRQGISPTSSPLPEMQEGFDIQDFLQWLNIPVRKVESAQCVTYYRLESCPFKPDSRWEWRTNPSITMGETLGFVCHHVDCCDKGIGDVLRWAQVNGRGKCPVPLWKGQWEISGLKFSRRLGIILPHIPLPEQPLQQKPAALHGGLLLPFIPGGAE